MEELQAEENSLRNNIAELHPEDKKLYYQIEQKLIKDPDTYAVLNWFLPAGIHHFYLGKTRRGLVNLVIMLVGLATISTIGIFIIILVLLIELPQLFRSQQIVYEYNNNAMKQALAEVYNQSSHIEFEQRR
jgi:TM2 domain-containing membrane protein YozV